MATVGNGRPRVRSTLTRQRVLQAAVALADESGSESLSMRRLGEAVGVEAMSLYHHVASKDDLLDGMIDAVFGEIDLPSAGDGWSAMLRSRANSTRRVLCRHGWAIRFMDSRTAPGPATLRHHDAALGCLREAGFPLQLAGQALSVLDSYVYGFALRERTLRFGTSEQDTSRSERLTVPIPPDVYPHLAESIVGQLDRPGCADRSEFDVGLDLILGGIHPPAIGPCVRRARAGPPEQPVQTTSRRPRAPSSPATATSRAVLPSTAGPAQPGRAAR